MLRGEVSAIAGRRWSSYWESLGHSRQAAHEWYTALADLFEPQPAMHRTVIVHETNVAVEDREAIAGRPSTARRSK